MVLAVAGNHDQVHGAPLRRGVGDHRAHRPAGIVQVGAAQPHQQTLPGRVAGLRHQAQPGGLHLRIVGQQTLQRLHHHGGVFRRLAEQDAGAGLGVVNVRGTVGAVLQQRLDFLGIELLAVIGARVEHQADAGGDLEQAARRQCQVVLVSIDGPLQGLQIGEEGNHRFAVAVLPLGDGHLAGAGRGLAPIVGLGMADHEHLGGQQLAVEFRACRRITGGAFEGIEKRAVRHGCILQNEWFGHFNQRRSQCAVIVRKFAVLSRLKRDAAIKAPNRRHGRWPRPTGN